MDVAFLSGLRATHGGVTDAEDVLGHQLAVVAHLACLLYALTVFNFNSDNLMI